MVVSFLDEVNLTRAAFFASDRFSTDSNDGATWTCDPRRGSGRFRALKARQDLRHEVVYGAGRAGQEDGARLARDAHFAHGVEVLRHKDHRHYVLRG